MGGGEGEGLNRKRTIFAWEPFEVNEEGRALEED